MTVDEIMDLWEKDSYIGETDLHLKSLQIPQLHHKYIRILKDEHRRFHSMKERLKQLKLKKEEFYKLGPDDESKAAGWEMPAQGRIFKPDIPKYLEADEDIVKANIALALQSEKCNYVKSIMDTIMQRTWHIGRAIDWKKFENGVG